MPTTRTSPSSQPLSESNFAHAEPQTSPPETEDMPWLLVQGSPDSELLEALTKSSAKKVLQKRLVPVRSGRSTHAVWLTPQGPLARGQRYTLALPTSAAARYGLRPPRPYAFELAVTASSDAGASLMASLPAQGQSDVAQQFSRLQLAFRGTLRDCQGFELRARPSAQRHGDQAAYASEGDSLAGQALPLQATRVSCAKMHDLADTCCELRLRSKPDANQRYILDGSGLRDPHGGPVGEAELEFSTGAAALSPAVPTTPATCGLHEAPIGAIGCLGREQHAVTLRFHTARPSALALTLGKLQVQRLLPVGPVELVLQPIPSEPRLPLDLRLQGAGEPPRHYQITVEPGRALPPIAISEVLANPRGPEPGQEYIELYNYGASAVSLEGLHLADGPLDPGVPLPTAPVLAAGSRLLLVSAERDYRSELDPSPPPGTLLLPVESTLTPRGLANGGETLVLRDQDGRALSASPAVPTGNGQCLRRRPTSCPRRGAQADFEVGPCDPGR